MSIEEIIKATKSAFAERVAKFKESENYSHEIEWLFTCVNVFSGRDLTKEEIDALVAELGASGIEQVTVSSPMFSGFSKILTISAKVRIK